jgi:NAD(P)-dependent dehydrogenase (short-subunit alcohol dehydrogenase family)
MIDSNDKMQGKITLITGATNGIGRVTAQALAQRGATVILVGRDADRLRRAAQDIKGQTPDSVIHTLLADLSSQEQVRRLAGEIQQRFPRLDVLINNAGAVFAKRRLSVDGVEMTLALNHLAPFLLTNLLLGSLRASDHARIITVASVAHVGMRIPFDDLNHERGRYQSFVSYGQTKLMNILFTYELARRLKGTAVTANAVHPGFVGTNFGKNNGKAWNALFTLGRPFAISPTKGAQTSIFLASSPDVTNMSGQYFTRQKAVKSSPASYDLEAQKRLWTVSERLTGLQPGALT